MVVPGAVTSVEITGIEVGSEGPDDWLKQGTIKDLALAFQLLPALRGAFGLERLSADGIAVSVAPKQDAAEQILPISAFLLPFARLLDSSGTRDLELSDLTIVTVDDTDGWSRTYALHQLVAKEGATAGQRSITADGTINNAAAKITADFAAPVSTGAGKPGRGFSIDIVLPGFEQKATGTMAADGSSLEADFDVAISSLGDQLELLQLKREFDGTASLTMTLSGDTDALVADAIKAKAVLSTGEHLTFDGRIGDFSQGTGVDLAFAADLKRSDGSVPRPSSAFDIELEKIQGEARGAFSEVTLSKIVLDTNLADADLASIGPVSVQRATRDKDGRLAFRGVRIISGDPKAPSLDLQGDILDVLNRSGIHLAGSFDLDPLDLAVGKPAPPEIGRLTGKLSIGDASGSLRLESLSGRLTGDGPLKLTLEDPPATDGASSTPLQIKLDVTDFAALAKAFGAEATTGGSTSFEGTVDIEDDLRVAGQATIGQSPLSIDLHQDVTDGRAVFRGKLGSSALHLADLQSLAALQGIGAWFDDPAADAGADDLDLAPPSWLDAELDVAATVVSETGAAETTVAAHLVYRDGKAALDPLQVGYAGGELQASMVVGLADATPPVSIDGTAKQFELADIVRELGGDPLIDAPLGGTLKLTAQGDDTGALEKSVGGSVEFTLGAGTVGTSLIDLTGETIVGWLFTSGDHAELVCGEGSVTLQAGRGTVDRLVVETANVQLVGKGSFDLGADTIDVNFVPRPLHRRLVEIVTPFRVHGKLSDPKVDVGSMAALAGRAVGETLALPLNAISALIDLGSDSGRVPCASKP